ncbi:glycosyltransferase [Candidatus Microgenomates bacterium]|nr:glycosyltransferase [Candidatus Microgenomates bacterium]
MTANPLVSVIVGTKNSKKYLDKSLRSIKNQSYKNWELILVDNYSTDSTLKIAKNYTKKVFIAGPERSIQYNLAASKAKGKYLYRIDADFFVEPEVLAQAVGKCEKEKLDAIAVHNTSDGTLSFWAHVRQLERDCYIDDDSIVAVRFFKKSAFNKVGGFDEKMYAGEDYDLHNRLIKSGFKWGRIKAKEIHLGEVTSIWDFAKKSFSYGKNSIYYVNRHSKRAWEQMTPIRGAFLRHWKDMLKQPVLVLGLIFMTLVKYSFGGLGFMLSKLKLVRPDEH